MLLSGILLLGLTRASVVTELFADVTTAQTFRYDMKDDQGAQMACVHVYEAQDQSAWEGQRYFSVYHALVGSEFEVRLARSDDLMTWSFVRTLLHNADMPYISRTSGEVQTTWLLLTHEQWMNPGSTIPSQLGFKLYYNESDLAQGGHFNSFVAPLTVGRVIEGTPSIYRATALLREGYVVVDVDVGFHYNDEHGKDQVASGKLTSFGPTVLKPAFSGASNGAYNALFISKGAIGNIGQRRAGVISGTHLCAQEANIGSMPPTEWALWRVWLYFFSSGEGDVPSGQSHNATMLTLRTHQGSTAVGNPSWQTLSCPNGTGYSNYNTSTATGGPTTADSDSVPTCLFVSYFLFGEGAKPGEAGVVAFVKKLP